MKRLSAVLLVLAVALFPVPGIHAQATTQKLKIISLVGQVQYRLADGTVKGIVPNADGTLPDVPAGAEIIVVNGNATFQSGGTVITANTGDTFTFSVPASGQVQIAATGTNTSLTVAVGGTSAAVNSGDTVAVTGGFAAGNLTVVAGNVPITSGGQTTNVATGGSATVDPTAGVLVGGYQDRTVVASEDAVLGFTENVEAPALVVFIQTENSSFISAITQAQNICGDTSPSTPC